MKFIILGVFFSIIVGCASARIVNGNNNTFVDYKLTNADESVSKNVLTETKEYINSLIKN